MGHPRPPAPAARGLTSARSGGLDTPWLQDRRALAVATGMVALGLLLRVYRLGAQELWLDEASSFHKVTMPDWLDRADVTENNPPLFYLLLRLSTQVVGQSEAALRLPSALLGTLFVVAAIWVGSRVFNRSVGLWGGLVAAVSPLHVYYSQEARTYALLVLALLVAYGCLWRALEVDRAGSWLAFSAAAVLTLYSHYFGALGLLAAVPLVLAWPERRDRMQRVLRFGGAIVLAALLFTPWVLWAFVLTSHSFAGGVWIKRMWEETPPLLAVPKTLEILGLGGQAGLLPIQMKQFWTLQFPAGLRLLGLTALVVLGVWVTGPWGDRTLGVARLGTKKLWLGTLLLLPLAVLWTASFVTPVYVVGRYDLVALPPYVLLLGLALAKLQGARARGRRLAPLVALALLVPVGVKLVLYYRAPSPQHAQKTARILQEEVQEGDVVVFTGVRGLPVLYYLSRLGYGWREGECRGAGARRRFPCRMFPREVERHPTVDDQRIDASLTDVLRRDTRDLVGRLRPGGVLWVAFDGEFLGPGRVRIVRRDAVLVDELGRLGYRPAPLTEGLGIVRFRPTPPG